MDLFFTDPNEVPLPPAEVRIRELRASPNSDGRRVRVYLEIDPFQRRPSADLEILDSQDRVVSSASVIETVVRTMEMTLHLREVMHGPHRLVATLYYSAFEDIKPEESAEATYPLETKVVDTRQIIFDVPAPES